MLLEVTKNEILTIAVSLSYIADKLHGDIITENNSKKVIKITNEQIKIKDIMVKINDVLLKL